MKPALRVPDGIETDADGGEVVERTTPRPLSPTKLLPFLSHPHRSPNDVDLEALRRRLHHAPRPLKKRSSITEPEGPAGPNIQKLLYQKTTLAAMETVPMEMARSLEDRTETLDVTESSEDSVTPPPLPLRSPVSDLTPCCFLPPPLEDKEDEAVGPPTFEEEFPPYAPPPYATCGKSGRRDDVTGQVAVPLVGVMVFNVFRMNLFLFKNIHKKSFSH